MIERYTPNIQLAVWLRWFLQSQDVGCSRNFIDMPTACFRGKYPYYFINARSGLQAYFLHLKEIAPQGTVLIPAQICPVVTYTVVSNGLSARFVDSDVIYPSPSARQYRDALDQHTAGIVISPSYGYLQSNWEDIFPLPKNTKIILDLAQGLLLSPAIDPRLVQEADAIIFSFALGKGIDTGGALLLTSTPLSLSGFTTASKSFFLQNFIKAMILRFLIASNLYSFFTQRLDQAIEADKECGRLNISKKLAPASIMSLWQGKIGAFARDVQRARERAINLGSIPLLRRAVRDQTFFEARAMHLRQIIRFKDQSLRHHVLMYLRNANIDCSPAGEPLPSEYSADAHEYPNAAAFRREALRLPFLGRLPEKKFNTLQQELENALGKYLS